MATTIPPVKEWLKDCSSSPDLRGRKEMLRINFKPCVTKYSYGCKTWVPWNRAFSSLGSMGNCACTSRTFSLSLSMRREAMGSIAATKCSRSFTRDRYSSMFLVMMVLNASSSLRFVKTYGPFNVYCRYKIRSGT
ncbi:hypothetical protein CEXT_387981 [Caerostris extrusa]|uniref:Uncharacterized protein n=1 Tax=Caerostris extrusa TaxID=172846 RepID=A0AAV4WDP9_CAEEX|nr:hypothetical protein CEXT_387981 [Caerostris extrusa]